VPAVVEGVVLQVTDAVHQTGTSAVKEVEPTVYPRTLRYVFNTQSKVTQLEVHEGTSEGSLKVQNWPVALRPVHVHEVGLRWDLVAARRAFAEATDARA